MNKKKQDFLIIGAGLVILILLIGAGIFLKPSEKTELKGVTILTNGRDYKVGDSLKIKIENNSDETICFSSCYPYYFEKKSLDWTRYNYKECTDKNLVENCVESRNVKAFELTVPLVKRGTHRIAVSACTNCAVNDLFRENKEFYSNYFDIQ